MSEDPTSEADVQKLVDQAMAEAVGPSAGDAPQGGGAAALQPADMSASTGGDDSNKKLELLRDVDLNVKIELGRTHMLVEDVLKLGEGSVVELDKLAGDPVDVYVNDRLVARGEVLVLNDNFCIRISEIVSEIEEAPEEAAEMVGAEGG